MVDQIKIFDKINCLGQCVEWWTGLSYFTVTTGALSGRMVSVLACWPMVQGSCPSLGKTSALKTVIQLQRVQ